MPDEYLTGAEVAELLKLNPQTVYHWIDAGGLSTFELARVMGTSALMIERHYGTLLDGATESIAARLTAFEEAM
jgi:hypothetical protein